MLVMKTLQAFSKPQAFLRKSTMNTDLPKIKENTYKTMILHWYFRSKTINVDKFFNSLFLYSYFHFDFNAKYKRFTDFSD